MLMEAAKNGHTPVVELLMDYPDIQPLTEAQVSVRIPPATKLSRHPAADRGAGERSNPAGDQTFTARGMEEFQSKRLETEMI